MYYIISHNTQSHQPISKKKNKHLDTEFHRRFTDLFGAALEKKSEIQKHRNRNRVRILTPHN